MKKGVDYIGVGVGAMVFNNQGQVLLAKRGQNAKNEKHKWDFPGGSLEFGEKCAVGLKREFKEEFDIAIEILELLEVVDHIIKDENQHWVSPSYIARLAGGEPKIMEPSKIEEIKWVSLEGIDFASMSLVSQSNWLKYKEKYGLKPPEF